MRPLSPDPVIEDIYPLSPLQQGMLFFALSAPRSGVYLLQTCHTLKGAVDSQAFRAASEQLLARHSVLRTAFVWEDIAEPVQVVFEQATLPFVQHDWRGLAPSVQQDRLEAWLRADREQAFDLAAAPLMRVALFYLADDTCVFVWTRHHILLDGWSMAVLLNEFLALYQASRQNHVSPLAPAMPYRDYIAWLQSHDLSSAENFWRDFLNGFSAAPMLPFDLAAGQIFTGSGDFVEHTLRLPGGKTAALEAWARQRHLTLSTLFQGLWGILLSQYSGERDVVFGVTTFGRPPTLPGINSMVGLFLNTVPLRLQVEQTGPLADWLQRVQQQFMRVRDYEYAPLARIQTWSEMPRGQPMFETEIVFENYPIDPALRQASDQFEITEVRQFDRTDTPLVLMILPGPALTFRFIFTTARFEAESIARLAGHFDQLLETLLTQPEPVLPALSGLTPDDRRQLLEVWSAADAAGGSEPVNVCQRFDVQAAQTPDSVAVISSDAHLTYGELNRRAARLARSLRRRGVGPDVCVGLCVERSPEMIVGLLGILKAGGVHVPLDPAYPQERLAFMLADARAAVLLTQSHLLPRLPEHAAQLVCLDTDFPTTDDPDPIPDLQSPVLPAHLAYLIYTSGSTGRPKGVMVSHQSLANYCQAAVHRFSFTPDDRLLQFASISWDTSVEEIFPSLLAGATLVLRQEAMLSPTLFWRACEDWQLTCLNLPTAFWHALVAHLVETGDGHSRPGLRLLIIGGERALADHVERWRARMGTGIRLVNTYGATEATAVTTQIDLTENGPHGTEVPIGRPLPNAQVYLLDRELRPVPVGGVGELCIGGESLARGYWGQPGLTAEKFVPHPFNRQTPGSRLYKTGDLGRWRADGVLIYVGRRDQQVKVRGYRIELGEIEAVLRRHDAVRDCVVVAREPQPDSRQLAAYVVAEPGRAVTAGDLLAFARARLPGYMVPAAWVFLESLPLTPNGKVDRRALPEPQPAPPVAQPTPAAGSPVEEVVAGIWAGVLGVERVSRQADFFALGGHSLLAIRVITRLQDAFGVVVPLTQFFEQPTVAGLAEYIETARRSATPQILLPPVVPAARDSSPPLSFAQQRLWFIYQLSPESSAYHIFTAVRLTGRLERAALIASLNEVVRRHSILRTIFPDPEQPTQVILPELCLPLPLIDLAALPEPERERCAHQLAQAESVQPFDFQHGPLLRSKLLRLAEDEHIFLLTLHHIVSDGWSVPILVHELTSLYRAYVNAAASPLPELPVQHGDFAAWQRAWLQGDVLANQLAYWKKQLAGMPALLTLPTDRPRRPVQTYRGAYEPFLLSVELSAALNALSRREGVTLAMTLLAAFQVLLYRHTGQTDIVVSSGVANRRRQELEPLIGPLVNILLMRADLSRNPSFQELLKQVRRAALEAYEHQDLPFEQLVEALQPERDLSYSPLAQVMFVLHNTPVATATLPGLTLTHVATEGVGAQYDLLLRLVDGGEQLQGRFEYNTDLFDAATIQTLRAHWETLLAGIVADPQQRVAALPLLTEAERQDILFGWNATEAVYPRAACVHELFEAQAAAQPDAAAVVSENGVLTYGALNSRATQLAHQLRALGVGPNVCVGLCVERSPDWVVGMLGTLKAGGAYVPLDPAYPKERLAFMLTDSQTPVLITQSKLLPQLPEHSARAVCLDADGPTIGRSPISAPRSQVLPENLAYVIYTSGSTGRPKGVLLDHRGRVNNFSDFNRRFQIGPGDRLLGLASLSFDMCAYDVLGILAAGAALVLPSPEQERDPAAWAQLISTHHVTVWHSVPTLLAMLVETVTTTPAHSVHPLRLALLGGDWIPVTLPDQLKAVVPGVTVISLGGATEASMDSTLYAIEHTDPTWRSIPYGRPMANQTAYVLDEQMCPVPVGVAGELHLGGIGLAWGYLNRPDLTAEKFVPNPFVTTDDRQGPSSLGSRLYKTGDLARWRANGQLELLGRLDYQVKVRGYRIELGEIAATLRQHPGVSEAVVVSRALPGREPSLVGYFIASPGAAPPGSAELRAYLKVKLPEYMVPTACVRLETFPLSPNGKLDRRALPTPEAQDFGAATYVPPRNRREAQWAAIWQEVLGHERVGITDNFFDLGGDSFKAVRVVRQMGNGLGLLDLFKHPVLGELAELAAAPAPHPSQKDLLQELTRPGRDPDLTLICVPYGGGNAVMYQPLADALPDSYVLYSIDLPGHDFNREQEAFLSIEEAARRCLEEIKRKVRGPVALFGHCAGVALTLEVARLLEENNIPLKEVFLGGALLGSSAKPHRLLTHLVRRLRPARALDEAQLLAYLKSLGRFEGMEDPDELSFAVRTYWYDSQCTIAYFDPILDRGLRQKLKAPIVCLMGDRDPLTLQYTKRYKEWQVFSDSVRLVVIAEGDHYFVKHKARDVARWIVSGPR